MWYRRTVRRRQRSSVTKHYLEHKEQARTLVLARLAYWNQHYNYSYNRVAIRNTRSRWGSCSELGNLNFSYRILFLPQEITDYIVVHELCHLKELNHSRAFWELVEETHPHHLELRSALRALERAGIPTVLKETAV